MKITLLEIGNDKNDTQSQIIDFDGSLEKYLEHSVSEIRNNTDLDLLEAQITKDGSVLIDYFSKPMNKNIRHYAFTPLAPFTK